MSQNTNNQAAFIWSLADLLRGDFRQSQYGRIILPFTLLRRLEGVLEDKKEAVLTEFERLQTMNLPEDAHEKFLLRATGGLSFFNTSTFIHRTHKKKSKFTLLNCYANF